LNVIALHRNEARSAFFPAAATQPIFFDATIKAWVVANARHCEAMLVSPHLSVSPYRLAYEDMAKRNPDFAFPNMLFAFRYIPMCVNGEEHRLARRRIAEFVAARKNIASSAAPRIVERWVGKLTGRTEIELMTEVLQPMVREFLAVLSGTDASGLIQGASAVFDRMMSARQRRQLDDELGAIRAAIRRTIGPDGSEEEEGIRLALFVLGNDALAGGFGESLCQVLRANPQLPMSEIDYPALPNETGIPFVERIVREPFELDGVAFRPGDRIRIMLQSFLYSGDVSDRARVFGAGIHACLGRQLSLELWSAFTKALAQIPARAEILDYALRDDDYVFTYPSKLLIALNP